MGYSVQNRPYAKKDTTRCDSTRHAEKSVIRTLEGDEVTAAEQAPIPCFRCGLCCIRYQPPLSPRDVRSIASALGTSRAECLSRYALKVPIREGYLLKRTGEGCVFLAWDADEKARCTVHPARPRACREWTPSLARPECREGVAGLKAKGQIMRPEELFSSDQQREQLYRSLTETPQPSQSPRRAPHTMLAESEEPELSLDR